MVHTTDGSFYALSSPLSDWTHVVMNYIGPEDGQGIRIYVDGIETGSDVTKIGYLSQPGEGRIVVGRLHTDQNENYASVEVDELMFFNATINDSQVTMLAQF